MLIFTIPAMAIPAPLECSIFQQAPPLYDEILNLIDAIEEDQLDSRCSSEQIEKIAYFISILARNGAAPSDPISLALLNQDIDFLLCDASSLPFLPNDSLALYSITPAVSFGDVGGMLCKSWISKQCHSLKKFVQKHKTAIIIGAVVVVAVAVAVVAVAALSGTAAATSAAAAGAGAVSELSSGERPSHNSSPIQTQLQNIDSVIEEVLPMMESPTFAQIVEENAVPVKEALAQVAILEQPLPTRVPFSETAREFGSHMAHKILDETATLASVLPQLMEEIGEISAKFLPESMTNLNGEHITPIENYNASVLALHEKIDNAFSTTFADHYTPEAKANDPINLFTVAVLPPPVGGFSGKKGWELKNPQYQPTRNAVTTIDGRLYRGHAIDQMQNRGIPPSVVEETIRNGERITNQTSGTIEFYDSINKTKVIMNEAEEIVTVIMVSEK